MNNKGYELEKFLLEKADINNIPINGILEISPVCNLDCKMCFIRMTDRQAKLKGGLKTADEWLEIARQMKEAGTLFLLLTGGEVFLYKDFKYLYTELNKMGFVISINTNGTLINEETVEWLSKIPPRCVRVTLYGSSDDTYKKLCNDSKGYTKATRGIDLLIKNNITVKINATITNQNKHDIVEIHEFAKSRDLRCDFVTYTFPPTRKCNELLDYNVRLSPKEAAKEQMNIDSLQLSEKELFEKVKASLEVLNNTNGKNEIEGFECRAGHSSYFIGWNGKMQSCAVIDTPYSLPFEDGFNDSWEKLKTQIKSIKVSDKCINCKKRNICQKCGAAALTETKSFNKTPEYLCEMTDCLIEEMQKIYEELKDKYEN